MIFGLSHLPCPVFHLAAPQCVIASEIGEDWGDCSTLPDIKLRSARASIHVRFSNVWSDLPLPASDAGTVTGGAGMYGVPEAPPVRGRTLYSLFYLSMHEHAWMAAYAP
ncbi:hypothetical protein BJY52DRAFT_1416943 [Lactarius psammicola]|nr:hypothetical protein BJY52DRAFT_1416943 [Lactarius psammicola]